jgi:hypothetical protein
MRRSKKKTQTAREVLTGIPGVYLPQVIGLASRLKLYVLVEPARRNTYKWTVYDRATGRNCATYWPGNGGYVTPATDKARQATDWTEVLETAAHYRDSFPRAEQGR